MQSQPLTPADLQRFERDGWRQIPGNLKAAKRDRIQARIMTETVRGVLGGLLGKDATWAPPKDWGLPSSPFPRRAPGSCRPGSGTGTIPVNRTWTAPGACSLSASSARSRRAAAEP